MTLVNISYIITIFIKNVSYLSGLIKKIPTQLFIGKKGAEKMGNTELDQLRQKVEEINLQLLSLINERASAVQEIGRVKESQGVNRYDPVRERHMLDLIKENNNGPFDDATLLHLFKQIFKAGLDLQKEDHKKALLVSRKKKSDDTVITIKGETIGAEKPQFVFGPCSVESYDKLPLLQNR